MPHPAILALGEAMIEFNQTRPGEPHYLQGYGGDTSNAAVAASRQGAPAGYLTRVGDDSFGVRLRDMWEAEGVATQGVRVDAQASTGVYFVNHDAGGHRFTYLRRDSAASRMTPSDLPLPMLHAARYLHLSAISQAISTGACDTSFAAMDEVRRAGGKICYDTNLRLPLWPLPRARAIIWASAAYADYFLPSLEDAQTLTGVSDPEAVVDACLAAGARTVLLKMGATGVLVADGDRRERVPGFVVNSVDATGAGDCFAGSLLARLLAGDALIAAVRYANAAAALSTTGYGAVAPIPRPEAVRALLAGSEAASRRS